MSTLTDLAINYLAALADKDIDAVAGFFADDISLHGPSGPVTGKSAAVTATSNLVSPFASLTITPAAVYQQDSTVITELTVVSDGNTSYFVNIFRFTDEKISDIKLYTL